MLAVKKNQEVKIVDIQKEEYLEKGYTILNEKLEIIAEPQNEVSKLKAEIAKLKAEVKKKSKE